MTLADILRKYFERRRQICDVKTRYLTLGNSVSQFISNPDQNNTDCCRTRDINYFSNDLNNGVTKNASYDFAVNKKGVDRRKRVTVSPDGVVEYETITKDSNGSEEVQTVRQRGDKLYVTIRDKKPSGEESVDEKVIDISHLDNGDGILKYIDENYSSFDEKNFERNRSRVPSSNAKIELENLKEYLRLVELLSERFDSFQGSDNQSSLFEDFSLPDFSVFDDFPFKDEKRTFFKDVKPEIGRLYNVNPKQISGNRLQKEMDKFMKKMTTPQSKSIFESFSKNAMVEIPDEKTPLDKFVELDEDTRNSMLELRQENDRIIRKLDRYFSNPQQNAQFDRIYSDIEEPVNGDAQLILPDQESRAPDMDNFGDIFLKSFAPPNHQFQNMFPFGGMQSQQMFIDNGKIRIVSMKTDQNGHKEKTVTYKIGDRQYTVKTITDKSGQQLNKEKKLNFPEEELSNFKKQWHENFHSDFND